MNKATKVLSLTTGLFFASTVYLAVKLHRRDAVSSDPSAIAAEDRAAARSSPVADDMRATTTLQPKDVAGNAPTGSAAITSSATAASASAAAAASPDGDPAKHFARQLLARYDDSDQRVVLVSEARAAARRQYGRLKEQLRLSESTFEQLVGLLADQQLDAQVHWARCAVDPRCDPNDPTRGPAYRDRADEFLALLGAERIDAFNQYRDSLGERDAVAQLRGRLPDDSFLPQMQAEQLVSALAEERRRYSDEVSQQGSKLQGWGTNLGMLWYPDHARTVEQQLFEASQYSQRLRTRAAGVLSPAQFAAFVQMQEELLAQMAAHFRPPQRKDSPLTLNAG
jgi:hypothetical protein